MRHTPAGQGAPGVGKSPLPALLCQSFLSNPAHAYISLGTNKPPPRFPSLCPERGTEPPLPCPCAPPNPLIHQVSNPGALPEMRK